MNSEQEEVSPEELEREAMNARRPQPGDDDGTGVELCPCCLREVAYQDNLCPHCGAPVSGIAGLMPWEKVLAEGYIYRQAVAAPRKPVVLIGIWMIFLPTLVMSGIFLGFAANEGRMPTSSVGALAFWTLISVAILYQTTRNYFRPKMPAGELGN